MTASVAVAGTIGGAAGVVDEAALAAFVRDQFAQLDLDGRSLCLVIPDGTRRCPLPSLLGAIQPAIAGRVRSCTAVVALGTHAPMTDSELRRLTGTGEVDVVNHAWWDDTTFVDVGTIGSDDVTRLSQARISEPVDIRIDDLAGDLRPVLFRDQRHVRASVLHAMVDAGPIEVVLFARQLPTLSPRAD